MIGIFDSGIGGLTVVREFKKHLSAYDIIYFGDTARTPYGSKSPETVIKYAIEDANLLLNKGAKIIVAACNTVSSIAVMDMMAKIDVPVFEVINPAVELALKTSTKFRIGIIGTRATIKTGFYERQIKKIKPEAKVYSTPCPLLVPLAEEGWFKKPETSMIVKKYLHSLKVKQIDTLILGCTHYPLLKHIIQRKIGKRVNVIDSSVAIAEKTKFFLEMHKEIDKSLTKNGTCRFFVSDITEQFQKTANSFLKQRVNLEHIKL